MATENSAPQQSNKALIHAGILISIGVLATTLAQVQLLARIPLQNLLKNELHVPRATNAAFFFWVGMAWYLKPFFGIINDAFPLFGSRRKSYLLISSVITVLLWAALIVTPHEYAKLLAVAMVINVFQVIASTVVGGYMVEVAQAASGSGRLSSIRNFVQQTSYIISGPMAGVLGAIAFGWTAAACGGVMFLLVPATIFLLHERPVQVNSQELLINFRAQLVKIINARTMWAAAGLMALFYLAPGLSTATFYKEQNDLHMNTQGQGFLQFLSGIGGILAAGVYGLLCKRWNLRRLLLWCLILATGANLMYLFYTSVLRAQTINGLNGFGYTLAEVALMDLAIRATPAGSEALGFSLMMSVRNLALFGTDWIGSKAVDSWHVSYNMLVIINSVTTAITIPLALLLPLYMVMRKDAELIEEPAAPRTVAE